MKLKKFFRGKMVRWMGGWYDSALNQWKLIKVTLDGIVSAHGQPNSLF